MSARSGRGAVPPRATPGSTEDTLALALAYYEAFNALDVEALRTLCAPDVVLTVEGGRLQGHDELIGYVTDVHHHFPGIGTDVRVTALTPEHVVCEISFAADSSTTVFRGAEWQLGGRGCEIFEIEGGRITDIRNYHVTAGGDRTGQADVLRPGETFKLAQEQAALRRVAGLVARDPIPDAVFAAVNHEIGLIVGADATSLFSFHDDDTMTLLAAWSTDGATFPLGDRRPMNPPMLEIRRTGVGYRFDVLPEGAPFLEEARAYGVRSAIAVPLLVEEAVWSVVFVTSRGPGLFPADTEDRVLRFTRSPGSRSATPAPTRTSPPHARASSPPPTPRAGRSSATCTTARSNGSCRRSSAFSWLAMRRQDTSAPPLRASTRRCSRPSAPRPSCTTRCAACSPPC